MACTKPRAHSAKYESEIDPSSSTTSCRLRSFYISNDRPFDDPDGEELLNDEVAWQKAVMTVRDAESNLDPDKSNRRSIVVKREENAIFQIDVTAKRIVSPSS
ncbi:MULTISPECIES: hypothetical protein [Bradyrhizobium]|nr:MULTISPECIES: hypothetical protein [Bradyrhizobium]MCS3448513.1 hypothetical protein [Bradyrhizobium elkanii]MCS3560346.1 hypothetical protein [Bradyrhizobium elkanii]MCW2149810.1 hypothetical protein [Bradyrhizobium elkanii]MCW2360223.1 hypothetical protein [Bradyrhizobium elkanii]MCW2373539.1 hypothetical protein [Bradyrhizobium elkanii]